MKRIAVLMLICVGVALAVTVLFGPLAVSIFEALQNSAADDVLSARRVSLLLRGFRVAGEAALLTQLIGVGLAAGFVRPRGVVRTLTWWIALCTLLTPTYIHAYAWSLIVLPAGVATSRALAGPVHEWLLTEGRAVWCLATWMSPIAGAILAAGWRESGRAVFQIAQLDAGATRSARTSLGVLIPWCAVSLITCYAIALTEFAVCHLSLCLTWNTEILVLMQDQAVPGGALRLAWPLLVGVALCCIALWFFRRPISRGMRGDDRELHADVGAAERRAPRAAVFGVCFAIVVLLAPIAIFIYSLHSASGFAQLGTLYANHASWSAIAAVGSVLVAAWIAILMEYLRGWCASRRRGNSRGSVSVRAVTVFCAATLIVQVLFAVSPPALIGDAFSSTYLKMPWIRDHWLIVSFVDAARFGVILSLALWIGPPRQLSEMARGDGASAGEELWRVRLPAAWRTLSAAALVVFVLSFNEIAATVLIVPPNVGSLPKTLLNAIHFGRNDAVIAMVLSVMLGVGVASGLLLTLTGRRRPSRLSN